MVNKRATYTAALHAENKGVVVGVIHGFRVYADVRGKRFAFTQGSRGSRGSHIWSRGSHGARIANALTEMFIRRIIREPAELRLYRPRERRFSDDRVLRLLISKVRVEVRHVQYRFLLEGE